MSHSTSSKETNVGRIVLLILIVILFIWVFVKEVIVLPGQIGYGSDKKKDPSEQNDKPKKGNRKAQKMADDNVFNQLSENSNGRKVKKSYFIWAYRKESGNNSYKIFTDSHWKTQPEGNIEMILPSGRIVPDGPGLSPDNLGAGKIYFYCTEPGVDKVKIPITEYY